MDEKTFKAKIKKMGGVIDSVCCVEWPETLQIKNRREAIDIIDVLRYGNHIENGTNYAVELDTPLDALKAAIEKGLFGKKSA
jgi:tRNA A37 threonylcarbamoyladenosine biosynthesis protein TsaE